MDKFLRKKNTHVDDAENDNQEEPASKKAKFGQKFRSEYTKEWPFLTSSEKSAKHVFCSICSRDFSVGHGGRDDCRRHVKTTLHQDNVRMKSSNHSMSSYLVTSDDKDVTKAELLFMMFLIEHNLPLSCADHAGKLFKKMFPDSKIASKYGSGRTKTAAMLDCLAGSTQQDIAENMKKSPFSLATDGSNDNKENKLYPLVVSYFSPNEGKIVTLLLSLLKCTDNTGQGIFNVIVAELKKRNISWQNCVAFSSDNAKTMSGHIKGVISYIRKVQPSINFEGCACHLLHIAAKKGCSAIKHCNISEFLIDIYYYLQKSSKRQHNFQLCQSIYGVKPHKILKYVETRWLSMFNCIVRVSEQWEPLKKFFCDNENSSKENARLLEIKAKFDDPLTKVYLSFLKNVLPLFCNINVYLQQEKPLIHKLHKAVNDLYMGLLVRFVKPSAVEEGEVLSVDDATFQLKS